MKRRIFKDEQLEIAFLNKGYVILPFLDVQAIKSINSFYLELKPSNSNTGFHSTHFYTDKTYKSKVHYFIKEQFSVINEQFLEDYKIVFCNFMVKEPGENSRMPLHLDWTYVDESKYISLAIWCSLTDTNKGNGALGVVPGSQSLDHNLRGPKIESPFHQFNEEIIANAGKLLCLKAGEGVVYNHKTMHYSPPNLSDNTRVAINVVLVPKEAAISHYCILDDPAVIYSFSNVDEEFFINYNAFEHPPQLYPSQRISNPFIQWDRIFLSKLLPKKPKNSMNLLKQLIKRLGTILHLK